MINMEQTPLFAKCKICGKEFDTQTKRGPYKTLCSIECKKISTAKYHSKYYEKNREEIIKKRREKNAKSLSTTEI